MSGRAARLLVVRPAGSPTQAPDRLLGEFTDAVVETVEDVEQALVALDRSTFDVVLVVSDPAAGTDDGIGPTLGTAYPRTPIALMDTRDDEPVLWLLSCEQGAPPLAVSLHELLDGSAPQPDALPDHVLSRGLLDALEAATCAVDQSGVIVAVNAAWVAYGEENGGDTGRAGPGVDYAAACEVPDDSLAARDGTLVGDGLRAVLSGQLDRFRHDYPCHSPQEHRWFSVRIAPVEMQSGRGALISHVDITLLHTVQQGLVHHSMHDTLTGLPNLLLLTDRLTQALADAGRMGRTVGVAFLDLDQFTRVNASLGHAAGDALLVQVAERLRSQLRGGDTAARFAGDEFVVLWRNLALESDVALLSHRLTEALAEPFVVGGEQITITASMGVVVGRPEHSSSEVLVAGDGAMHDAKKHGRGLVRVFQHELSPVEQAHLATEMELLHALSHDELVLHYQPVIDLASGRPVGVEALMRWQHPRLGLLQPGRFIPEAEQLGVIVQLGHWALLRACHDIAGPEGCGLDLAVNVSVRQLMQPDLVDHVREALAQSRLDPARLILEVTESAVVEDEACAGVALDELSNMGVRLAIDDFGTGFSSLLYLRRYPFSVLKLDRAFVSGLGRSRDDEAISRSVVSLAGAVGATSVAEGVETAEQLAELHAYGCHLGQGFLWSPAVPLHELPAAVAHCRTVALPTGRGMPEKVPATLPRDTDVTIHALHHSGASLHTIAAALNRSDSRTATGARWTATTVAHQIAG